MTVKLAIVLGLGGFMYLLALAILSNKSKDYEDELAESMILFTMATAIILAGVFWL